MKEKKSNIKNVKNKIDEQTASIVRLVGLFLIVYGILCFTSKTMGSFLCTPFTFLLGSFSPIALLILILLGCYMLLFKKLFSGLTTIQYILLSLIVLFSLILATTKADDSNLITIKTCFDDYLSESGANYSWKISLIYNDDGRSIASLGGGMIGYIFCGLLNTITGSNQITWIISLIIFVGLFFIFLAPYISKIVKKISKIAKANKEKRKAKKKLKEENKKIQEDNVKEEPIVFNVKNSNKVLDSKEDDLLETTEINITGDNFSYVESTNNKQRKLDSLLSVYDDEIYPMRLKKVSENDDALTETFEVRLSTEYDDDFKEKTNEINQENEISNVLLNDEISLSNNDNEKVVLKDINTKEIVLETNDNIENKNEEVKQFNPTFILNENKIEKPINNISDDEYKLPPLYLLNDLTDNGANAKNADIARQNADILMEKMKELNVDATINAFVVGPSVTRFEISLAPGVRVGTFINLQEDLKLSLGANSIRIESPIPGKSAIGIEVPNVYRANVSMKEIITLMPNKKHKLYVPVGKDIAGVPLSFPICDMPHCLISGATNSGKSVCVNTIILSLLMNYKPSELKFIMVDPKLVEMSIYNDIPHMLCPIITDSEQARVALDKLCVEMDKRFKLFSSMGIKNIGTYNELMINQNKEKMPFIILIVDEFAKLILCKNKNLVEENIQKLAQLGRAAGIHLILATQRPDVNVIPGTIKSNLPCRMTFRLASFADSRTVIDVGGAEKLLNNGDMLLLTPDFTGLRRVQGVYVTDKEILDVVEYCKKQSGPQYQSEFLDLRTAEQIAEDEKLKYALSADSNEKNASSNDPLFEDIKTFVIKNQRASTSYLQRKFNIGYGRAARYIDMLEEQGIVGPENGSNPREVLVSEDYNEFDD